MAGKISRRDFGKGIIGAFAALYGAGCSTTRKDLVDHAMRSIEYRHPSVPAAVVNPEKYKAIEDRYSKDGDSLVHLILYQIGPDQKILAMQYNIADNDPRKSFTTVQVGRQGNDIEYFIPGDGSGKVKDFRYTAISIDKLLQMYEPIDPGELKDVPQRTMTITPDNISSIYR